MARRRRIKKIKVAEEEFEKIKCAFCKGKGKDPFEILSPLSNCPVCHGRGVVRVRKPYEKCKSCDGTGVYTGSHLYCWTCHGKGVVPKKVKTVPTAAVH